MLVTFVSKLMPSFAGFTNMPSFRVELDSQIIQNIQACLNDYTVPGRQQCNMCSVLFIDLIDIKSMVLLDQSHLQISGGCLKYTIEAHIGFGIIIIIFFGGVGGLFGSLKI